MNALAIGLARLPRVAPEADVKLMDHLRELQARLLSVVVALVTLVFLAFAFGARRAGPLWVPWPSIEASVAAEAFRAIARQFTPPGVELVVTSPLDGVVALLVVSLALATFAATPAAAWHAAAFLSPAMRANERRAVGVAVPLAVALFLAGAAFAWLLVVPTIFATLYGYAAALDARLLLAVPSLVSFAAILLLVFGLSFELPLVMAALSRAGLVQPRTWVRGWRHATISIVVAAAVVTPDPTVVSQAFVAVPLLALYALGALGARALARPAG